MTRHTTKRSADVGAQARASQQR